MKIININWSGPYSYEEVINKDENKYGKYSVKPKDKGLYQIYGSHPVYGDNVLIYIGKTIQPFYSRLKNRNIIIGNHDGKNIQIYLGSIYFEDSNKKLDIDDDIIDAESLLIHYHKPSHNSSSINSFNTKYNSDYIVNNYGYFRQLVPSLTTKFYKKFEIFTIINKLAKNLNIDDIYDKEDGYGFYLTTDIWFGVDYYLWANDTVLILMSKKNIFKNTNLTIEYEKNNIWFYEKISGEKDKIEIVLNKIKKNNK